MMLNDKKEFKTGIQFYALLLILLFSLNVKAQKFGYMDSEYILQKMPEYTKAQESMDKLTEQWTKDVADKYEEVAKLRLKYQQEEILLTPDLKLEKQKEIEKAEEDLRNLNNSIFGINGMLFQKKKEILKPIIEQIYKSSEKIARKYKLSFIFDKASDLTMFYADPKHDYTDFILEDLGLK